MLFPIHRGKLCVRVHIRVEESWFHRGEFKYKYSSLQTAVRNFAKHWSVGSTVLWEFVSTIVFGVLEIAHSCLFLIPLLNRTQKKKFQENKRFLRECFGPLTKTLQQILQWGSNSNVNNLHIYIANPMSWLTVVWLFLDRLCLSNLIHKKQIHK